MKLGALGTAYNAKYKIVAAILFVFFIYFKFYVSETSDSYVDLNEKIDKLPDIPTSIEENASAAKVHEGIVEILVDDIKVSIFTRKSMPSQKNKSSVIFLHGAGSSSIVWHSLRSLQLCAAMGFEAIALDLPGWGNSKAKFNVEQRRILGKKFLPAFFKELKITRPVIVSPSMSGLFSINYMMDPEPNTCSNRLLGFISLAPVKTGDYSHSQYHKCDIPTAIVYGSLDNTLGLTSTNNLRNMPRSEIFIVRNGTHAWYVDRSLEWNKLLHHFLTVVSRSTGAKN